MALRKAYMLGIIGLFLVPRFLILSCLTPSFSHKTKIYNAPADAQFLAPDKFCSMHKLLFGICTGWNKALDIMRKKNT
jgi:hypothetical protein